MRSAMFLRFMTNLPLMLVANLPLMLVATLPPAVCASAPPMLPATEAQRERLCHSLQEAMARVDLDATWSIRLEFGETARTALQQEAQTGTVRIVALGDRMWASVHWDRLGSMPGSDKEMVVRGDDLPILTRDGSNGAFSTSIADFPNLGIVGEDLPILAQWFRRSPSVAFETLPQAILAYPSEAVEFQVNGQVLLRVLSLVGAASDFDSVLVLEGEPTLRLAAMRLLPSQPGKPAGEDAVANGGEAQVSSWVRIGESNVPARLERTNYAWFPHQEKQDIQRTIYELVSSGPASSDPIRLADLAEWTATNSTVADDRVGVVSRIGDDTLSLGGTRHRLRRPLRSEDVLGKELLTSLCVGEEIAPTPIRITDAASQAVAEGESDVAEAPWRMKTSWIAPIVGVLLWSGALLVLRRRRTDSTKRNSVVPRLAAAAGLALIVGSAAYSIWQRDAALESGRLYDLGTVLIAEGTGLADGAVEFTAHADHERNVVALQPSCACLKAQLSRTRIAKGERLVVPVSLSLSSSGEKQAFLTAVFDDGEHEVVHVRATGVIGASDRRPRVSSMLTFLPNHSEASITVLLPYPRMPAPAIDWRLPPEVTVSTLRTRYLVPLQERDEGQWEVTTTFARDDAQSRALIGTAVMEVDGAQVAAAMMVGIR